MSTSTKMNLFANDKNKLKLKKIKFSCWNNYKNWNLQQQKTQANGNQTRIYMYMPHHQLKTWPTCEKYNGDSCPLCLEK